MKSKIDRLSLLCRVVITSIFLTLFLSFQLLAGIAIEKNNDKNIVKNTEQSNIENEFKQIEVRTQANLDPVMQLLKKEYSSNDEVKKIRSEILTMGGKAVFGLIQAMKDKDSPDKNRWMATMLLGQIMGKKASDLLAKFAKHPNWVLRVASLKVLLALKEYKYKDLYRDALKDESLIVRTQALENIKKLQLAEFAPHVWAMLYDKLNYQGAAGKNHKRGNIIRSIVQTIGDLKFEQASIPLLKMIQKKKYEDIFSEIDYSLSKITGKSSPSGDSNIKRIYWSKIALEKAVI